MKANLKEIENIDFNYNIDPQIKLKRINLSKKMESIILHTMI